MATIQDFNKIDIRVGKIMVVEDISGLHKPSYKLTVDFGPEIGTKYSTAQLGKHYSREELIGKKVLCVINLPTKQIGPSLSEVLTLGVPDENNDCILVVPDKEGAVIGSKLY